MEGMKLRAGWRTANVTDRVSCRLAVVHLLRLHCKDEHLIDLLMLGNRYNVQRLVQLCEVRRTQDTTVSVLCLCSNSGYCVSVCLRGWRARRLTTTTASTSCCWPTRCSCARCSWAARVTSSSTGRNSRSQSDLRRCLRTSGSRPTTSDTTRTKRSTRNSLCPQRRMSSALIQHFDRWADCVVEARSWHEHSLCVLSTQRVWHVFLVR